MIFAFLLWGLTASAWMSLPLLVLLSFTTGIAMALNNPSYQALVPQLVPREDLANAIALNAAQFNMSRVVGPTLGRLCHGMVRSAGQLSAQRPQLSSPCSSRSPASVIRRSIQPAKAPCGRI